ncbi:MAG: thiosulfate oxidation carrier protein SoxY [Burkholderiales bacterium]|jgi:sulfur-oxidizing protein SoxY
MDSARRAFVQRAGNAGMIALLVTSGFLKPRSAQATATLWNKPAFDATTLEQALGQIVDGPVVKSTKVEIIAPAIAENGAVVPVGVVASMPDVESVAILCEKNPHPLAAIFEIPEGTVPEVKTRVKMAGSANVVALARAGGGFYIASTEIKVTRGGCGG